MVNLFEEEIHIMQLFNVNQSIRNVRDISNATHDRPIPSIGTIFNIISKSLLFGIVGCITTHNAFDVCFLKLNIGNKYGLCSELKKCPGIKTMKSYFLYFVETPGIVLLTFCIRFEYQQSQIPLHKINSTFFDHH
jgi:hypothetical protein